MSTSQRAFHAKKYASNVQVGRLAGEITMSEPLVIRCRENGPLVLAANFKIVDHEGNAFTLPQDKEWIALCRCGQSQNKPFCDGRHRQCGFKAAETAVKAP
jgi:CDGSH-type Zn-finger protein